jgi:RNase H-like domain found in reverse transcriptase
MGVGAVYGQGSDWQTCRPAGFLSKKFSAAQQHYRMHEHETIAVLKTQKNLSPRQIQWWEFLSHFNYSTLHIDGVDNKVVDCLLRYYVEDSLNESHPEYIYVHADLRLDPDGELLPTERFIEVRAAAVT